MPHVTKITLPLPLRMGTVNCYLLQGEAGMMLVDTGPSYGREALIYQLEAAGVTASSLKLIAITHGDFDHTGNAAYLRERYGTPIAMHSSDIGMASQGDMFANRKSGNALIKWLAPVFFGFKKGDRFEADIPLMDGDRLDAYGIEAQVIEIPGHSSGSIGILTDEGELFSGDLFENSEKPGFSSIMDDPPTAQQSAEKLDSYVISTIYPGHGEPFQWTDFQPRGKEENLAARGS